MVERESRFCRRGIGAKAGGLRAVAAVLAGLAGLAGCNPVETYRNWTGVSENDPNPKTTPNTKNLAAGAARSYPNLATVPAPPSQGLTMAELDKLTQSLIADRKNAKYTSERLQATFDEAAAPPPPPPPVPAAPGSKPATAVPGSPNPPPAPGPAPPPGPGASAAGLAAIGAGGKAAPGKAAPGKAGQPPEPGPMESSLQSPQIGPLPQPEAGRPAAPPPRQLAMPAAGSGGHLPAPPAPAALPAAIGSARFQPAPPPPTLPPPEPVRTATATAKPPKPAPPGIVYAPVADIAFPGDAATLGEPDRARLGRLVERYREKPGAVRVVGYAGIGSGAAQQLDSYRIALDRAQAVAAALAKAGVPAGKIAVQAAPAVAGGQGRAEILFAQ